MHVSNLLTAVKALEKFAAGKGTISPFCAWVGDAKLSISKNAEAAHLIGADGKLLPDISQQEAVTAVLLLVALRATPAMQGTPAANQSPA